MKAATQQYMLLRGDTPALPALEKEWLATQWDWELPGGGGGKFQKTKHIRKITGE